MEEFEGTAQLHPWPSLLTADGRKLLVIDQGKHGGHERLSAFDGKAVTIRGHRVERDGLVVIELAAEDQPIRALAAAPSAGSGSATRPSPRRPVTLEGEIVDSKCYTGVMKPGEGKAHKACASLCIRGGIPPVLVTFRPGAPNVHYLLVDGNGKAFSPEALEVLLDVVGEPVIVDGALDADGPIPVLHIEPGQVRRR